MVAEAADHEPEDTLQQGIRLPLAEEEGELRPKNQITIPRAVAKALGLRPGDRLIFVVREGEPDEMHVRRVREDYAGALAGVYGSPEEAAAYVRQEQGAWSD